MDDKTVYEFTVNGKLIKTEHEKLTAADIIRLAIAHGAITGNPEDYVLAALDRDNPFKADETVDLLEYKAFVTEKSGSTPVA